MMFIDVYGHIMIICIGIPVVSGVVYNLREVRIKHILLLNVDKIKSDIDSIIQIITIQQIIANTYIDQTENVSLIGIINLHVLECQNSDCPCKNDAELYDADTGKFSDRNLGYHKDKIFLNYFTKRLYEDANNKFINSVLLHISFSSYLFYVMKNTHASLIELDIASKKKPSVQQSFNIYKMRVIIENSIKEDSKQGKGIYSQVTEVIHFEELLGDCQKTIEKVTNLQIEFWSQAMNQLPDLNTLNDLGNKIFITSKEVEQIWKTMCKINPTSNKALSLYGTYLIDIRNNHQPGYELLEK